MTKLKTLNFPCGKNVCYLFFTAREIYQDNYLLPKMVVLIMTRIFGLAQGMQVLFKFSRENFPLR
jgi:hypothetical protein